VTAWGHHLYTTFSRRPDRFAWDPPTSTASDPLYVVAMAGRKSHGVAASLGKYVGLTPLAPMLRFAPTPLTDDAGYDPVAALYDQAFADIGVRAPEIAWLDRHLPQHLGTVLDLGCGNGALLARFAGRMARGVGLDASPAMVERARSRQAHLPHLEFAVMREPVIPLADRSVDVVVSLLSWRYLDWDPLMAEIRRVLKPGGRLLIVDMAALPLQLRDLPAFVHDKAAQVWRHRQRPEFARDLGRLVADPRWAVMLQHNPIRADHEYRWYLQSRFPGGDVEILTVGGTSRVLAFDSGPLAPGWTAPQSYP
jgi:SAM-dependent methyltransferase